MDLKNIDSSKALDAALATAYTNGNLEAFEAALKAFANPNKLLDQAVFQGKCDFVQKLLEYGAQPDLPNPVGELPLEAAISCGEDKIVDLLLAAGADPSWVSGGNKRGTLAAFARNSGQRKIAKKLVAAAKNYPKPRRFLSVRNGKILEKRANDWHKPFSRLEQFHYL